MVNDELVYLGEILERLQKDPELWHIAGNIPKLKNEMLKMRSDGFNRI